MSEEKYKRLMRMEEFTDDERVSFISRQIVETRQGTKAVTDLLSKSFPDSSIVYVKAGNVSDFRKQFELIKCRTVNDYHHANDAYLNIVVGNVYDTKFTQNPYNFIKEYHRDPKKNNYHMNHLFDYNVVRGETVAWKTEHDESIGIVKKVMKKNTPLVTRMNYEVHGGMFDQNIISAQQVAKVGGAGYAPVKSTEPRMQNVCKYGGYNKATGAYFFLVEYEAKGKKVRALEAMPAYRISELDTVEKMEGYCKIELGYRNPCVRVKKIKMYSLLKVNGFYLYLTGRSGNQLLVCNAVQMALEPQYMGYCKKLDKAETMEADILFEKIGISKMENLELYDVLTEKHKNTIYAKRPNPVGEKLVVGREAFIELPVSKQVFVIQQILQLSQIINKGANLVDIGGVKSTGVATLNKKIDTCDEFKLISQSIAGLYAGEIDLLTV